MRSSLLWIALAAVAAGGSSQFAGRYDAVATSSYSLADGSEVKLAGVCSFTADSVSCWNRDLSPNTGLREQIEAHYIDRPEQTIEFTFNRKNRLIAFTRSSARVGWRASSPQTGSLPVSSSGLGSSKLFWVSVDVPSDVKTTDLVLSTNGETPDPTERIPFVEGNKIDYEGSTIQLGGARPAGPNEQTEIGPPFFRDMGLETGKRWLYFVEETLPPLKRMSFSYVLLDKAGREIKYVDRSGRAVSELEYVRENPNRPDFPMHFPGMPSTDPNAKYLPARVGLGRTVGPVRELSSNVDPRDVGFFQISGTRQLSILFKDIPLDPK